MANKIDQYTSLGEFAWNSKVKISTIKKRYKEIPGIEKYNDDFRVRSGTRYPYNMRNSKIRTYEEKAIVLLKAIDNYSYISHKELRLEKQQFECMLKKFLEIGFIQHNGLSNHFGANAYDCTGKGSAFLRKNKFGRKQEMAQLLGEMASVLIQVGINRIGSN